MAQMELGDLCWYNDFYYDPNPPAGNVDVVRIAMVTGWKDKDKDWPWLRVFTPENDIKIVYAAKGAEGVRATWYPREVAPPTPGPPPDGSVTTQKIVDGAVTAPKIGDGAVTAAKLAPLSVATGTIQTDAVSTRALATGAVTANELNANAVTTGKILDKNVTLAKLADAVSSQLLAAGSIGVVPATAVADFTETPTAADLNKILGILRSSKLLNT